MKTSYKNFPSRAQLTDIGLKILADSCTNDSVKFGLRPGSANAKICHIFAKHRDVTALLGPGYSNQVDLSLYDAALRSGGGGAEFFISAEDKSQQWSLLMGAMSMPSSYDRDFQKYSSTPTDTTCPASFIENQAHLATRQGIEIIRSALSTTRAGDRTFNPIEDYGYLITHLMVRNVVGLKMTGQPHFLYRIFKMLNRLRGKQTITVSAPEIKHANELVFWIEVMFGQLFVNPGDLNKLILYASKIISKKYRKVILASIADPVPDSLIERMTRARLDIAMSNDRFEELVTNIVMELVGSFQYLTGRAFAGVHETIQTIYVVGLEPDVNPLKAFNALLASHPRAAIDEALRHNSPTGFIFRTASKNFTYNHIEIKAGELLCMLCNEAVKDPSVFPSPEKFYNPEQAAQHESDYLTFASPDLVPSSMKPHENHHPCFGQYWARTIIAEMLEGLEQLHSSINE